MKEKKLHFLMRGLQVVLVFSLFVVALQVYLQLYLPSVVDKYAKKYTQETVTEVVAQIEQELPQIIGTYMEESNSRLTNSISEILEKNALANRQQPETVQDKIDRYLPNLLELNLPGQAKVVLNDPTDVVLFEFMDYQCGFCKRFFTSVKSTKESHQNLQVQYIDYPVLGNMSVLSATMALALSEQGLYDDMHTALMQHQGRLTPQALEQIGEDIGIDKARLDRDMKNITYINTIRNNLQLGKIFDIKGTPYSLIISLNSQGRIVGEEISGYVNAQTLSQLVIKYTND